MEVRLGNIFGFTGGNYAGNVYDKDHLSPTLNTMQGGCKQPMIIDSTIVAMRGRNPTNPSDRTPGIELEQTLEVNQNGTSNCLTSVQKDNLVLENVYDFYNDNMKQDGVCGTLTSACSHNGSGTFGVVETINKVGQISNDGSQYGTVIADNGLSPNLVEGTHGYANSCIATQYRIRKLTPRECWRLMDFSDEDFEKAAEVNSNTQLYKQAGNSIVTDCLKAIFRQMNINGVDKWNG